MSSGGGNSGGGGFFGSFQSQSSSSLDISYSPYNMAASTSASVSDFFGHVFDASFQGKVETMNLLQYGIVGGLVLVPFMVLIESVVPALNFHTSSPLLVFEIVMHLVLVLLAFLLAHRITSFIPTISGVQYEKMSYIHSILPFLIIVGTIHTKIAGKLLILGDRFRAKMGLKNRDRVTGIGKYPTVSSIFQSSSPPSAVAGVGTVSSDPAPYVHNTTSSGSAGPIALANLPGGGGSSTITAKPGPLPASQVLGLKF